jgi:hypothetical protein
MNRDIRMKNVITLLLALAWTSGAAAADWVRLMSNVKGDSFSVDLDSESRSGDKITAWMKTNYANIHENSGNKVSSSAVLYIYNCHDRSYAIKNIVFYSELELKGDVVSSSNTKDRLLEYSDVVPGSVVEEFHTVLCSSID